MTTERNQVIADALWEFLRLRAFLEELAIEHGGENFAYTPETCPLAGAMSTEDHWWISQMLFGLGCWQWTCGFCGREDSE